MSKNNNWPVYPAEIKTGRLTLSPVRLEHAEAVLEQYAADPEVTKYMVWGPLSSVHEVRSYIAQCEANWRQKKSFAYVITRDREEGAIGMIDARPANPHLIESGYVLARAYWGQGYMTEALRAIIRAAFANESVGRFQAVCDTNNEGSARVMEKCGMMFEGIMRQETWIPRFQRLRDTRLYAMTREDFEKTPFPV